jgi:hypothetical protein
MNFKFKAWVCTLLLALLFGCGGGGGGGTGGTGADVVSSGVMTKGSVIVNGVRFEDTTADIVIDDTPKTAADLQDGMVVQVRGTLIDGGGGRAQQVEAQIEVRGIVTSINTSVNPQQFVVFGQTVIVDDQTVFSNLANVGAINVGVTLVEVHGLRDVARNIRATRVEANSTQMGDSTVDEIRGVVIAAPGSNPTSFSLGTQAVNASGASIFPAGATYSNGSVVEVHCMLRPCVVAGVFQASRIEVESAEDFAFQPARNESFEVEGLISGFTVHPGNFFVAGVPVVTSTSTQFEGGLATDLSDDVKVEAEGVWTGSVLSATKIEFKRSVIRLQGVVTAHLTNITGSTFTLTAAGRAVIIETDSFTSGDFTSGNLPPIGPNCIQVRGQRKAVVGTVVTAGEIDLSCSSSNDHLIQAPVEAESGTTITLLGFPIDVGAPTDIPPYEDTNGNGISGIAFFTAVVPANPGPPAIAGTLVKVRFDTPGVSVKQVELED